VDDRIAAGDQRVDGGRVVQRGNDDFLAIASGLHRPDVGQPEVGGETAEPRSQRAPQIAGGPGQEQALEEDGLGCGGGHVSGSWRGDRMSIMPPVGLQASRRATS
jgi:hypothetical protein